MRDLPAKAKTLFTALPTYIILLAGAVTALLTEAEVLGLEDHPIIKTVAAGAVWLFLAAGVVRRVTPVPESQRGLTPGDKTPIWMGDGTAVQGPAKEIDIREADWGRHDIRYGG